MLEYSACTLESGFWVQFSAVITASATLPCLSARVNHCYETYKCVTDARFYPSLEGWWQADILKNKMVCSDQGSLPRVLCLRTVFPENVLLVFYSLLAFLSSLPRKIEALKSFSKSDLVGWFKAHRGSGSKMLSVHVSAVHELWRWPLRGCHLAVTLHCVWVGSRDPNRSLPKSGRHISHLESLASFRLLGLGSMNWKRTVPQAVRIPTLIVK